MSTAAGEINIAACLFLRRKESLPLERVCRLSHSLSPRRFFLRPILTRAILVVLQPGIAALDVLRIQRDQIEEFAIDKLRARRFFAPTALSSSRSNLPIGAKAKAPRSCANAARAPSEICRSNLSDVARMGPSH